MTSINLLLLGRFTDKGTLDMADATECWHVFTISLYEALRLQPGLNVTALHLHHPNKKDWPQFQYGTLPPCDVALFHGLPETWHEFSVTGLRSVTGCKLIVGINES